RRSLNRRTSNRPTLQGERPGRHVHNRGTQTVVLLQTVVSELNTGAAVGGADLRTRDRFAVDRISIQLVAHDLADRDDVRVNRTDNPRLGSNSTGTNVLGADGTALDESGADRLLELPVDDVNVTNTICNIARGRDHRHHLTRRVRHDSRE